MASDQHEYAVDAVILCAGNSSRLGRAKQYELFDGKSLLRHTAEIALDFHSFQNNVTTPLIVSGPYEKQDREHLKDLSLDFVTNGNWERGMGSSLQAALKARQSSAAVLILLVDQYRVTVRDLIQLYELWIRNPRHPASVSFNETLGPPVIWPARYFPTLINNLKGRKKLLQSSEPGILPLDRAGYDLDHPDDLETLKRFETGCSDKAG